MFRLDESEVRDDAKDDAKVMKWTSCCRAESFTEDCSQQPYSSLAVTERVIQLVSDFGPVRGILRLWPICPSTWQ